MPARNTYKLPELSKESRKLLRLVVEQWDKTNTWPTVDQAMVALESDVDSFNDLLSESPSLYLRIPDRHSQDQTLRATITGLAQVPGHNHMVKAFLALARLTAERYVANPRQLAEVHESDLQHLLPNHPEDVDRLHSVIHEDHNCWSSKSGLSKGWRLSAGLPIIQYETVRTLHDFIRIRDQDETPLSDPGPEHLRLLRLICKDWRKTGYWPSLVRFVVRNRKKCDVVRLLRQLPTRFRFDLDINPIERAKDARIRLTPTGVQASDTGKADLRLFVRILNTFCELFHENKGKARITCQDLARRINRPHNVVRRVGLLHQYENNTGIFIENEPEWTAIIKSDVTRFRKTQDYDHYLRRCQEIDRRTRPRADKTAAPSSKRLGQYNLIKEIGRGANGVVWKATDTNGREQAIKVFHNLNDAAARKLDRELSLAATLEHPGLVKYYSKSLEVFQGTHFIRMELVNGTSLKDSVGWKGEKCRPQSYAQVLHWLQQCLPPLAHMHNQEVVHRDLHAGNILITGDTLKIVDYGSARPLDPSGESVTFGIPGTYSHSAPEVWEQPSKVGPSSDYFSLGIIAYLLLTGKVPYWADSIGHLHTLISEGKHTPIKNILTELPFWLTSLVELLLLKDAQQRLQEPELITRIIELGASDPNEAIKVAGDEVLKRFPRPSPRNPWAPWKLTYREENGFPVISQKDVIRFQKMFPERFTESRNGKPARLELHKVYRVAWKHPQNASWFLEAINPTQEPISQTPYPSLVMYYEIRDTHKNRHTYSLVLEVTNWGEEPIKDYMLELEAPRRAIDERIPQELPERETEDYKVYQFSKANSPLVTPLYLGASASIRIQYYVNTQLHYDLHRDPTSVPPFKARIIGDGFPAREIQQRLNDLNNF